MSKVIFKKMINGLDFIHSKGIAHRDIKLDNIMVVTDKITHEPIPKFIDFGLSSIFYQNMKRREKVGSIAFMSPEIVSNRPHDKMTDIWSMGVMLYILLTGRFPFVNQSVNVTLNNIKH